MSRMNENYISSKNRKMIIKLKDRIGKPGILNAIL